MVFTNIIFMFIKNSINFLKIIIHNENLQSWKKSTSNPIWEVSTVERLAYTSQTVHTEMYGLRVSPDESSLVNPAPCCRCGPSSQLSGLIWFCKVSPVSPSHTPTALSQFVYLLRFFSFQRILASPLGRPSRGSLSLSLSTHLNGARALICKQRGNGKKPHLG